jgi:hypothetical protein
MVRTKRRDSDAKGRKEAFPLYSKRQSGSREAFKGYRQAHDKEEEERWLLGWQADHNRMVVVLQR